MGFKRTDRLSDIVKLKALILVTCGPCGRQGRFSPADILQFIGGDMEVSVLQFRCSQCGSRDVVVSADPESLLAVRERRDKPKPV
jgi:hypothetical protein